MIQILLNGTAYPENYLSWKEVNDVISRSEKYHGVIQTTTLDVQFIKDAYDLVDGLDNEFDVAAECTFVRQSYDNITGWTNEFEGYLDFTTLKRDNNGSTKKLTINAYSDNFSNKIIERQEIEIPYDRLETLDGDTIIAFISEYENVDIEGIEVIINTTGSGDDYTNTLPNGYFGFAPSITFESTTNQFKSVYFRYSNTERLISDFFFVSDAISEVEIDFAFYWNWSGTSLTITTALQRYELEEDGSYTLAETVYSDVKNASIANPKIDIIQDTVTCNPNDGLVLWIFADEDEKEVTTLSTSTLNAKVIQKADPTPCNFVPPFEMGTRIIEAITGQSNGLDSPILGRTDSPTTYSEDGIGSLYFQTNGKLVRQFPIGFTTDDSDKVSQLTFSLSDWFDSLDKVLCLGAGVKYEDGQYKLYVDDRKEFFINEVVYTVSIDDMEVDTFEKEKDLTLYYNMVEVGSAYEKPEEVSGLEEYNSPQSYSGQVPNENILDLLNKSIYAAYPFEFARRKPYESDETTDYKYDGNKFIFNVYRDGGGYIQHTDEDFAEINGLENISTYLNLNLSPSRNLKRFEWWLNSGLRGYQSGVLKYNASDIVTDLSTRKTDEADLVYENEDKTISTFESPKLTGNVIRFKAAVKDFKTLQENPYGLVAYPDVLTGETNYGYLGREISSSPIDKKTNFELWETTGFSTEGSFILLQDGNNLLTEDGGRFELES